MVRRRRSSTSTAAARRSSRSSPNPTCATPTTAKRFLQLLRQTVVELGLSDAELDKGSMRFDVNVSVRPAGLDELRTRTELKNMNSFNFAAKGIEREIARQISIYEEGGTIEQETLHFDPGHEESPPMRSKEEAQDYRYFPEPDLVPVHPPEELVERLRAEIGELPGARIAPAWLTRSRSTTPTCSSRVGWIGCGRPSSLPAPTRRKRRTCSRTSSSRRASTRRPSTRRSSRSSCRRAPTIPRAVFDEALAKVGEPGFSADPHVAQKAVSDAAELDPVIERMIAANPAQAEQFRSGKQGLLGFFVGQVMKETGGKADPRVVNERVRALLTP